MWGSNTRPVVRVQFLVQGEDAGDAADVVGELLGFVGGRGRPRRADSR